MDYPTPLSVDEAIRRVVEMHQRVFAFFVERRADRPPEAPTRLQTHALRLAADHDGMSVSELAQVLSVSPPTASQLVNTLVEKRLLCIALSRDDRRRHEIHVTEEGQRWLQERTRKRLGDVKRVLEDFSANDRTQLILLLERAIAIWQSHPEGSSPHGHQDQN